MGIVALDDDSLEPVFSLRDIEGGACFIFSNFPEFGCIATARSIPMRNVVNPGLSTAVRAATGHFIAKTRSLEDRKGTRDYNAG
jgi:hypothetical protein